MSLSAIHSPHFFGNKFAKHLDLSQSPRINSRKFNFVHALIFRLLI